MIYFTFCLCTKSFYPILILFQQQQKFTPNVSSQKCGLPKKPNPFLFDINRFTNNKLSVFFVQIKLLKLGKVSASISLARQQ